MVVVLPQFIIIIIIIVHSTNYRAHGVMCSLTAISSVSVRG